MAYKQGNPNLDNNFVEINAFSFRKLPVEIRTMILDCAIGGDTEMGSAIVAALRGDSKLYLEALELLNRTCVLTLAAKSNVLTPVPLQPRLSPEAKRSIQHLRLS